MVAKLLTFQKPKYGEKIVALDKSLMALPLKWPMSFSLPLMRLRDCGKS